MKTSPVYLFPGSIKAAFEEVGSKGLSLMQVSNAGLPVPPGFILPVNFFKPWMERLRATAEWKIFSDTDEPHLQKICNDLKKAATTMVFTPRQRSTLDNALKNYASKKTSKAGELFAVRSSSPEEDLEGASFAGGYETVLGVRPDTLEEAIRRAFASCLDYRVFVYKRENGFDVNDPKIAIVVQQQIDSDVAGVGFSLNPVTNNYDEAVINANFGLGETVVAGLVTPDTYAVDKISMKISGKTIGSKEKIISLTPEGGTSEKTNLRKRKPALQDAQVLKLTGLIKKVENFYKKPMDIEWAFSAGKLFLLQARPITGYVPLSSIMMTAPGTRKRLYLDATTSVQGMDKPVSVMSESFLKRIPKIVGKLFFHRDLMKNIETSIALISGGRMYLNVSVFLKLLGKERFADFASIFDELVARAVRKIDEKIYVSEKKKRELLPFGIIWRLPAVAGRLMEAKIMPEHIHRGVQKKLARYMADTRALASKNLGFSYLADELVRRLILKVFLMTVPLFIKSNMNFTAMEKLVGKDGKNMTGKLQFSLPNNITTEMGLALARVAMLLPAGLTTEDLETRLRKKNLPEEFIGAWGKFLADYGHRGFTELDLQTPSYREAPGYLFDLMISIRKSPGSENPLETFERNRMIREETYRHFHEKLLSTNPKKARKFASLYREVIVFGGYRELHKFYAAFVVDLMRQKILKEAETLCKAGRLDNAEQVFDLTLDDLDMARKKKNLNLRQLGQKNKVFIDRLKKVPVLPSLFDSRGLILRPPAVPVKKGEVAGVSVSPGTVRGRIKILHSPDEKELKKGEILVARSTDPGWTPLFVNAAAVVLEIGGVLQHGALVAREYGLPCIVGVEKATSLWKDGTLVEVDGTSGIIRTLKT